jgi:uncharacterized protein (DUF885 family)
MNVAQPSDVPSAALAELAAEVLESALAADPTLATYLGEHRYDALLPDPSPAARDRRIAQLRDQLRRARALVEEGLPTEDAVDAEVLTGRTSAQLVHLEDVAEPDWNPMEHNPGTGVQLLLSRPFAPVEDRLQSTVDRLTALPDYFAAARHRLADMPAVFMQTATLQLGGLRKLCTSQIPATAADTAVRTRVGRACDVAVAALDEHLSWLTGAPTAQRTEVRLGAEQFARKLRWTLGTEIAAEELLARAEAELDAATEQIVLASLDWLGSGESDTAAVRRALDQLGEDVVDDRTILTYCRAALAEARTFVAERDLLSLPDEQIGVIELPEVDRGVAVAYCRPRGPLERAPVPTEFAVSPTPEDWPAERVASFYREYNVHMLHNLTVHEAMPGHAVQLIASNRAGSPVTRTWHNGAFVEGWAVYTEELMARHGYRSAVSDRAATALRLQQLKMRLRTVINTILDIRYHCDGLTEAEAMQLMTGRGFQEEGEAAGKWRRVLLSSTQLCEYFTGYLEVSAVAADLAAARPHASERAVHDELLSRGSPPVPQLRRLLGLAARS